MRGIPLTLDPDKICVPGYLKSQTRSRFLAVFVGRATGDSRNNTTLTQRLVDRRDCKGIHAGSCSGSKHIITHQGLLFSPGGHGVSPQDAPSWQRRQKRGDCAISDFYAMENHAGNQSCGSSLPQADHAGLQMPFCHEAGKGPFWRHACRDYQGAHGCGPHRPRVDPEHLCAGHRHVSDYAPDPDEGDH